MMHVCKWVFAFAIVIIQCAAYATDTENIIVDAPTPVHDNILPEFHYERPDIDMPFITINTDAPMGMNWTAALEFADPALRPTPIVLPFLADYPIDNLEIKLRVLNIKF